MINEANGHPRHAVGIPRIQSKPERPRIPFSDTSSFNIALFRLYTSLPRCSFAVPFLPSECFPYGIRSAVVTRGQKGEKEKVPPRLLSSEVFSPPRQEEELLEESLQGLSLSVSHSHLENNTHLRQRSPHSCSAGSMIKWICGSREG